MKASQNIVVHTYGHFSLNPFTANCLKVLCILAESNFSPVYSWIYPVRLPFPRPSELSSVTSLSFISVAYRFPWFLSLPSIQSSSKSYQLYYPHISVITTFPSSRPPLSLLWITLWAPYFSLQPHLLSHSPQILCFLKDIVLIYCVSCLSYPSGTWTHKGRDFLLFDSLWYLQDPE